MELNASFWFALSTYAPQGSLTFRYQQAERWQTTPLSSPLISLPLLMATLLSVTFAGSSSVVIMMIIMQDNSPYLLCDLIQSSGFIHHVYTLSLCKCKLLTYTFLI